MTVYKVSMEIVSGGERIGGGAVHAFGGDQAEACAVAAAVMHGSFLWHERFPNKDLHVIGTQAMNRRDVPTSEVVYGPDMLPAGPSPR